MLQVMIVDDDDNVANCLDACIDWQQLGYEKALRASNGLEVLKTMSAHRPDVVITDLKMPLLDGTGLCRKVFEQAEDVSFIFLSAYEDFGTASLALKYNVSGYILKPITKQKIESLKTILTELAASCRKRSIFRELLGSGPMRTEIRHRLEQGDTAWFDHLFGQLRSCTGEKFPVVQDVGYVLVDILFEYFSSVGVESQIVQAGRTKHLKALGELHMKMDIIASVGQMYADAMQFVRQRSPNSNERIIGQIKSYINENYGNPLFSVADVAEHFHFSPDYISKLFSKYNGIALNPYLMEVRIQKAEALLGETNLSATEIAQQVGYSTLNYFTRVFKKQRGITPSEYRNQAWKMNRQMEHYEEKSGENNEE